MEPTKLPKTNKNAVPSSRSSDRVDCSVSKSRRTKQPESQSVMRSLPLAVVNFSMTLKFDTDKSGSPKGFEFG